ncbi:Adenosine kinase [Saliniradius amylolyticus]|uniref:Adenosine kinase n=1 Tax=Saliniradius amylolyticus TaxID=2183582 RepID=A0A2S2E4N1_9ALTE|nr:carbohydrate kinase family protein [Saliniradius amylolyticus]AWL12549.1 Adenosine kinase [Saliniradius amylolyticus]
MSNALISGSVAFDNILVFHDKFKNHISPENVHILNVCFMVPQMQRNFGGTAGNIAYNLKQLGGAPLPMATVGSDFAPYAEWMDQKGIPRNYVKAVNDHYTAQAFITTDEDDNQITAFHPGAMDVAEQQKIADIKEPLSWGIVSPNSKGAMQQHARQLHEAGVPFIFDPGQGLPMFDGDELLELVQKANILAVNDYEWQVTQEKTKHTAKDLASQLDALIVTRGREGADFYTADDEFHLDALTPEQVADPTGCGDAFRAGLLYGLIEGQDLNTAGQIGCTMGCIKVESEGPQNHQATPDIVKRRMQRAYGGSF